MTKIPITILSFADGSQPGFVNCELTDAHGKKHLFVEKVPVVTSAELGSDSSYPRIGNIACEVIPEGSDHEGRSIVRIDTTRPWGIESTEGQTQFEVLPGALQHLD